MRIAFIGLGEAATAIISGWDIMLTNSITAFDIKSDNSNTVDEVELRAQNLNIKLVFTLADALSCADIVFSTVTADQAAAVARSASEFLKPNTYFLDLNSCAPSTKQKSANIMQERMVRYVDVAVMEPVYPKQHKVPLLISGDWSKDAEKVFKSLAMCCRVVEGQVGKASSVKMVRSIMVKGLEALTAECTLAASAADVITEVFPSLREGHPKLDVEKRAVYNFERSIKHGMRRAAEMDEVALMVADLGLPNNLSLAAAHWQRLIAQNTDHEFMGRHQHDLESLLDELVPRIRQTIEFL